MYCLPLLQLTRVLTDEQQSLNQVNPTLLHTSGHCEGVIKNRVLAGLKSNPNLTRTSYLSILSGLSDSFSNQSIATAGIMVAKVLITALVHMTHCSVRVLSSLVHTVLTFPRLALE